MDRTWVAFLFYRSLDSKAVEETMRTIGVKGATKLPSNAQNEQDHTINMKTNTNESTQLQAEKLRDGDFIVTEGHTVKDAALHSPPKSHVDGTDDQSQGQVQASFVDDDEWPIWCTKSQYFPPEFDGRLGGIARLTEMPFFNTSKERLYCRDIQGRDLQWP